MNNLTQSPIKVKIGGGNLYKKVKEMVEKLSKVCSIDIEYAARDSKDLLLIECDETKITYNALPIKLESFAKLIKKMSNKEILIKNVEEIRKIPAGDLIVFVSPFCPHCVKTVELAVEFAMANPKINVKVIDALQFKDLSDKYNVISVPTLVVNDRVKLTGKIDENTILQALKEDKYYEYKLGYYAYMLKEGYADELLKDIKTKDDVRIVGDLLMHPMLKVRIGAMVLLEKLFENDPEIVEGAKQKIREMIKHGDFRIKEDAALILGKIGNKSDIELLKELLLSENADVRDSAIEAIEEIKERLKEGEHGSLD